MRKLMPVVVAAALLLSFSALSGAAELYHDQELLAEPHVKAEVSGEAEKGEVKIAERRGYWVKIQSGKLVGWTKLSNVKMEETITWMNPIDTLHDTGRLAAGN